MQIKKIIVRAILPALLALPLAAAGQGSSINTYSPYSMYGIGDLSTLGNGLTRSMGGAGVAYRGSHVTPYSAGVNYLNPASYSAMPQRAFVFSIGIENQNFYLKEGDKKSSYSGFNMRDISVLFPLAKKVGFGVSVTPFSSVGYRLEEQMKNENVQGTIGTVTKSYMGDGDITQIKAGLGLQLFKGFSLGADMIYYKGYIDRTQTVQFSQEIGGSGITNTQGSLNEDVSRLTFMAGFQYNLLVKTRSALTLGGTYRMGTKLKSKKEHYVPSTADDVESVYINRTVSAFSLANEISIGLFYYTPKWSVGADYIFANWGDKNKSMAQQSSAFNVRYEDTHTIKAGFQYTPNRYDVRRFFNRLSYRAGVRYQQDYMSFNGKKTDNKAVTLGIGFPLKSTSSSSFDLGFEYGRRGTTSNNLTQMDYFKFSLGFNFFGEDYWFWKHKYD